MTGMSNGTRRKILTASLGIAAYTALEGLACGNPVAPRCPDYKAGCGPGPAESEAPPIDAAPPDAVVMDAGVAETPPVAEPTP